MNRYCLLAFALICNCAQATSSFNFGNERGPYAVGFRAEFLYDLSRTYSRLAAAPLLSTKAVPVTTSDSPPAGARPIQTLIWYPASESLKPMNYGEYIEFGVNRENFKLSAREIKAAVKPLLKLYGWADDQITEESNRIQWATREAKPAAGKFPVVIYAPSFRSPAYENLDLCEYLASQGFIVLASPSQGAAGGGMTMDLAGINAQVTDIHFLMRHAEYIGEADTKRIAIVGFSWGGISNAFAAVNKPNVRALVFLDGSIRYPPDNLDISNLNSGSRFDIPMLYFSQRKAQSNDAQMKMDAGDKILAKLTHQPFYIFTMNFMNHQDYGSLMIREFGLRKYVTIPPEKVSASYDAMALYVYHFLNAFLKNDVISKQFMSRSSAANRVPVELISGKLAGSAP